MEIKSPKSEPSPLPNSKDVASETRRFHVCSITTGSLLLFRSSHTFGKIHYSEMAPHILVATLQSAFLSLCSSLVATYFTTSNPPVLALVIFSLLSTPPNYLWQQQLEQLLPGYATQKIEIDDGGRGVEVEKKLNVKNTALKFAFDQTVLAIINVTLFIGGIRLLQGIPLTECWRAVREVSHLTLRPVARRTDRPF